MVQAQLSAGQRTSVPEPRYLPPSWPGPAKGPAKSGGTVPPGRGGRKVSQLLLSTPFRVILMWIMTFSEEHKATSPGIE